MRGVPARRVAATTAVVGRRRCRDARGRAAGVRLRPHRDTQPRPLRPRRAGNGADTGNKPDHGTAETKAQQAKDAAARADAAEKPPPPRQQQAEEDAHDAAALVAASAALAKAKADLVVAQTALTDAQSELAAAKQADRGRADRARGVGARRAAGDPRPRRRAEPDRCPRAGPRPAGPLRLPDERRHGRVGGRAVLHQPRPARRPARLPAERRQRGQRGAGRAARGPGRPRQRPGRPDGGSPPPGAGTGLGRGGAARREQQDGDGRGGRAAGRRRRRSPRRRRSSRPRRPPSRTSGSTR